MIIHWFMRVTGFDAVAAGAFVGVGIVVSFVVGVFVVIVALGMAIERYNRHPARGPQLAGAGLRGVPPADQYGVYDGSDATCSEAGSKNCELRGCAVLGSCQRPRGAR